MTEALRSSYSLLAAIDGETALERALVDPQPDLILLDVMMPGMNGYDVCERLKADPATKDIPVIFVTSLDDPEDEAKGLDLGAVDYITKPISPAVVEARVRAHLQLKQAKQMLIQQNEVLEQRVQERTAEVVKMQKERVDSLKNFSNAVAHQIRNPVMAIGGMSGLMIKKLPKDSPLVEYAENVREGSMRLESLVGVISEYVSLTSDKMEPVSVKSIVDEALALIREYVSSIGRTFECKVDLEDGVVKVDASLVALAIVELLQNSVEFCENGNLKIIIQGGVGLGDEELTDSQHLFPVKRRYGIRLVDNGPGIPAENLPYVTDPFFTTKTQGVGMGLTKAKRIICEEHGGMLFIDSPAPAGAVPDGNENGPGTIVAIDFLSS